MTSTIEIVYLFLPLAAWLIYKFILKGKVGFVAFFIGVIGVGYLVFLSGVYVGNTEQKKALYEYDLDGDGSFSQAELIPEAKKALDSYTSDAGTVLAPVTALLH